MKMLLIGLLAMSCLMLGNSAFANNSSENPQLIAACKNPAMQTGFGIYDVVTLIIENPDKTFVNGILLMTGEENKKDFYQASQSVQGNDVVTFSPQGPLVQFDGTNSTEIATAQLSISLGINQDRKLQAQVKLNLPGQAKALDFITTQCEMIPAKSPTQSPEPSLDPGA